MRILGLLSFLLAFAVAFPAVAAGPFFPQVDFSATRSLTAKGNFATGPYAHAGGKERWDATIGGRVRILIRRPDLGLSYAVDPGLGKAKKAPLGSPIAFLPMTAEEEARLENLGREKMAGETVTKYRLVEPAGKSTFWFTDDGIPMRILGEGSQRSFDIRIVNVVRKPQPDTLFELPQGIDLVPGG